MCCGIELLVCVRFVACVCFCVTTDSSRRGIGTGTVYFGWIKMCVDISVVGSENTKHTQHFMIVELATTK